jgi:hypothetical protein
MDRLIESMFRNKIVKLIFLAAVTLVMRSAGVPWWNAFIYALFVTMGGGVILFMVEDFTIWYKHHRNREKE